MASPVGSIPKRSLDMDADGIAVAAAMPGVQAAFSAAVQKVRAASLERDHAIAGAPLYRLPTFH
jgi:hypothetical protein